MDQEPKIFLWYDSYRPNELYKAPHYVGDYTAIGKNYIHTLAQLLQMNISESLRNRLSKAKIGTAIKIHYLHSCGDLMVKRVDPSVVPMINDVIRIEKEREELMAKVGVLENSKKQLVKKIFE